MSWSVQAFIQQVDNLDPEKKDQIRRVFQPRGFGPVASSRHFVMIMSLALRGVHHEAIAHLVEKEKGERVPASAIRDYLLQHVAPELLNPHLYMQYLQRQPEFGEVETLSLLRKVMMSKIAFLLDVEGAVQDEATRAATEERLLRMVELTRRLVESSARIKQDGMRSDRSPRYVDEVRPVSFLDVEPVAKQMTEGERTIVPEGAESERLDERRSAVALHLIRELRSVKALEQPAEKKTGE